VDDLDESGLEAFGWTPFFHQQVFDLEDGLVVGRVIGVERTGIRIAPGVGESGNDESGSTVTIGGRWFQGPVEDRPTVGDWVVVDAETLALERVLERTSLIKRLAPGGTGELQLIAANIDTAFIVTSCNLDFNLGRIERYLAVILESGIQPVVVLTKADLADDVYEYVDQVRTLGNDIIVESVDARSADSVDCLAGWCGPRQTVALLGSSGVGKSTLVNSLSGSQVQETSGIREDDDKGRHTTTGRTLHRLPQGGVILDSPGMRELQVADAESGIESAFADIDDLAELCRFNDCAHSEEPGCAVRAAIESGQLDERRLASYFKLKREEMRNTETVAERHARFRQFGKMVRQHVAHKKRT
jgi:ribosome biogenesis GTPase